MRIVIARRAIECSLCTFVLFLGASFVHAQADTARSAGSQPTRSSDKRVTVEPYKGPPIYLDEKRVVVPPSIVDRDVNTDKYPDGTLRIERQIARFSDDHLESDGFYREFHPNGKPFIQGQYRNGRQDGQWSYYYDNGQLQRKASIRAGQLHGAWENFRADGTLAAKRAYEDGLRHGEWITYDDTGKQPMSEEHYVQGKLNGVRKTWHPNGQLRVQVTMKDGVLNGPAGGWDENGKQISEVTYVNGKPDGPSWHIRNDGRKTVQDYKAGRLLSERVE